MRYAAILLIALHCRSAPVTLGDNQIEPVYEQILRESSVKKRLADIDFNARNFTIEELFVLSLDRTEQLAIAAERTTIADATVRRSYGAWLPRLSVTAAQYAPLTPGFVVPGVRFTARQNIMTGLTEYGNVVGARLTRVAEEQNLRAEMSAHLLNVADAVLQLKLNHELTEQTAEAVRLTQSNLAEIRRRVSIGRNKRGDALKAEARLRQKQADLLAAEEREAQLKRYLVFLTGVLGEFSVNADTAPFTRDLTGKEEADISRRADIALGKTMLDLRKNELLAAHGGHLPNIYLDGSYRPALDASQTTSYFGGVVAEVPFFQGGLGDCHPPGVFPGQAPRLVLEQHEVVPVVVGLDEPLGRTGTERAVAHHRGRHDVPAQALGQRVGAGLAHVEPVGEVPQRPLAALGLVDRRQVLGAAGDLHQERVVARPRHGAEHLDVPGAQHVGDGVVGRVQGGVVLEEGGAVAVGAVVPVRGVVVHVGSVPAGAGAGEARTTSSGEGEPEIPPAFAVVFHDRVDLR